MKDEKPKRGARQAEKEEHEAYWEKQKRHGPYSERMVYETARTKLDGLRINAEELEAALKYLHEITGDEGFSTALLSLRSYGLTEGGLKQTTLRLLRESGRDILTSAAKWMKDSSQIEAERVAARYGVPGPSFSTVVRELISARKAIEKHTSGEHLKTEFPSGDTGRTILVRFAQPSYIDPECSIHRSDLFGVKFDGDGFAVVPDTRNWRREISAGRIASFGYLAADDPTGQARRELWKKLSEISDRKNQPKHITATPLKT